MSSKDLANYALMSTVPAAAPSNEAMNIAASELEPGPVPPAESPAAPPREIDGREGPEPTRFGDWEKNGRCIDF